MAVDKTLGYEYFYDPNHEMANASGKVYAHRLVASQKIGRTLRTDEHVHHIDGNKRNNNPENLMIVSRSEHMKIEMGTRNGVDYFNREKAKCCDCGIEIGGNGRNKRCSGCSRIASRKFEVDKEYLSDLLSKYSFEKVGRMYNVTGNAIRRRAKKFGII